MRAERTAVTSSAVRNAISACLLGMLSAAAISMLMNLLVLTGPFYMLQIYDRVLPAHSIPTLVAFSALALILFVAYGWLDLIRTRLMTRLAAVLDLKLADAAFDGQTGRAELPSESRETLRDLATIRQFLSGPAAVGLLDIPWLPIYVAVIFLLHPVIGWISVAGAVIFLLIAALNECFSRKPLTSTDISRRREDQFVTDARNNLDTIRGMGMISDLRRHWHALHVQTIETNQSGSDINASFSVFSRTLRLIMQSSILGTGAYLAINNELSNGALVACSIIFARALAPIDQAVAHWRTILAARRSWQRLHALSADDPANDRRTELRPPQRSFVVSNLTIASPDRKKMIVPNVSFRLEAGDCLGIVGASGAGKSSLIRALVGSVLPISGELRLDGATLHQWNDKQRGKYVGYLAQDVQLLDGSIAQNIARFRANVCSDDIIAAAELAGIENLIVSLPQGYETPVGFHGIHLSAGQKQRIGLARALFGKPFLIVLDEPNAHLDREGELELMRALQRLREHGAIIVVAAHRANILAVVNKMLLLEEGRPATFGSKEQIFAQISSANKVAREGNLHVLSA